MRASVIIPAYDEEERLGRTLQALLAQRGADFETIVVDNASTDRTAEVAAGFAAVKVVREDRKGTMWACERGRQEATGDVIVRMDADCVPEPDWLARGLRHFEQPGVVVVSGPYDYFDAEPFFRHAALFIQRNLFAAIHSLLQSLRLGGITMGGNTFIRASALSRAGGFNTSIEFYGDDTDVPKRLSRYGRCIYDRKLVIRTSARRFRSTGIVRLQGRYIYHFLKVIARPR